MGQRADRVGHETPGDEFAQGRGWNAGDEEDPTMLNEPGLAGLENDIGTANRAHDGEVIYEEADVVEVQPATTTGDRSDTTDDRTPETEAIRSDIEDTRANMSSTIDEIQDRLSPQRLKEQATDAVREATVGRVQNMASNITETARDTGSTLMDTIRQNPLPAALIGIGAGWLFMNARRNAAERDRWRARYEPGYYDRGYGRYGASTYGRSASGYPYNRYGQYGSSQSSQQDNGKMSQMADTAKDKLSDVGDRAQEMTDTVKERASDMAEQAQWQAQRARGWLERTWDENPLVVAGAALAAGALVGLSIPETAAERNMMGEASGNVLQKAASAAQDVTQTATQKAQEAISQADQTMSQQAQSSQQPMSGSRQSSAGSSGPSSQSAEDKLRTAQENIDSARSSLESGSGSQGSSQSGRKSSGSSR